MLMSGLAKLDAQIDGELLDVASASLQAGLPQYGHQAVANTFYSLARLQHYLWGTDAARTYFDTRNGMLGPDFSTKFSPWLAAGCLSARRVAADVERCAAAGPWQERGRLMCHLTTYFSVQ